MERAAVTVSTYIDFYVAVVQGCLVGDGLESELEAMEAAIDGTGRVKRHHGGR